jgi:hypothetical protein
VLIQKLDSVFGVVKPSRGSAVTVDAGDFADLQGFGGFSRPFEFDEDVVAEGADEQSVGNPAVPRTDELILQPPM